ncbi:hypothetical protein [Roseimarinus sediminis]|jgi:hypothetical protein|uniref:hypothetical protein n=1 Tax=Roseimarinus sediminis TaxID=1610899 RepID=UPI003D236DDB
MNDKFKIILLFVSLFWGVWANAQVIFSAALKSGISNIHGVNRDYIYDDEGLIIATSGVIDGNKYTYGAMFAIEAGVIETIKNSKISFEQAVALESRSYYSHPNPKYFPERDPEKTRYTFNAITVPFKVRYQLYNAFTVHAGVVNVFKLGEISSYNYRYNLRATLGADAVLSSKYIIGCEYGYDITPFSTMYFYDYFYRFDVIAVKLGIVF